MIVSTTPVKCSKCKVGPRVTEDYIFARGIFMFIGCPKCGKTATGKTLHEALVEWKGANR